MKALDLLPDGTFTLRDGVHEWRTRRPTIGEWRAIVEAIERADEQAAAVEAIADEVEKRKARREFLYGRAATDSSAGVVNPYIEAMAYTLTTLSLTGEAVDPETLPPFCAQSGPLQKILPHWRALPLDLSWDPTTAPQVETEIETTVGGVLS